MRQAPPRQWYGVAAAGADVLRAKGCVVENFLLWTTICPSCCSSAGLLFASLSFVASGLLGPRKRPTAAKTAPYECGIVPGIEPPTRFPVRFYLVAMIFIIFDIEIVFLYPWAVIFRQLGRSGWSRWWSSPPWSSSPSSSS